MIRRKNRDFYHLALSYICFGLVPTLIAGAVLFHRFKGNMEQAILDDMGRMVSYAAVSYTHLRQTRLMRQTHTILPLRNSRSSSSSPCPFGYHQPETMRSCS